MASTINSTAFTLRKQGSTGFVAATVSHDPGTDMAILDPTNFLRRGATYKAAVNRGAQDQTGNPLDQNASLSGSQWKDWTFKVRNQSAEVVDSRSRVLRYSSLGPTRDLAARRPSVVA